MKNFLGPFALALMASVGNAMFVLAQRKSTPTESPFLFIIYSLCTAIILLGVASFFFPKMNLITAINLNLKWILFSGVGLAITYLGFYYLYNRYGATYYLLYAILSFITTSVIVGVVLLKENFNFYYILSIVFAMVTLVLFFMGKQHS